MFQHTIFRAYDIRGIYETEFDADGFYNIARGFAQYCRAKNPDMQKIFVSTDGRNSKDILARAVIAGLKAENIEVVFGGVLPTPVHFFARIEGNFDAGIQISASHNPGNYNGLKLSDRNGSVCGDEIQKIAQLTVKIEKPYIDEPFEIPPVDYLADYNQRIAAEPIPAQKLSVVMDYGNGVGAMYHEIFHQYFDVVAELYDEIDGNFPNHPADPERPENLADLLVAVRSTGADYGFAFDGDADRLGIVTYDGEILIADKIMFALAYDFLQKSPDTLNIVIDAMSSATLVTKLTEIGANVIMSPTGHSFIERDMHAYDSLLGGEQSGHFMFGHNFYGHDDACLAAIRFAESVQNPVVKKHLQEWPVFCESNEKITVPDTEKFQILEKFIEIIDSKIQTSEFPNAKISTIDGIRLDLPDGEWAIVRCSNTSPKISIRIEAKTQDRLELWKNFLHGTLQDLI